MLIIVKVGDGYGELITLSSNSVYILHVLEEKVFFLSLRNIYMKENRRIRGT